MLCVGVHTALTVMSMPAQIGMLAGPKAHTRNKAGTGVCAESW